MLSTLFQHSATGSYFVGLAFSVYLVAVIGPYLLQRRSEKGDPEGYRWHFFVPCDRDAAKLRGTITALRWNFPDAHIWVHDDAGLTPTAPIVSQLALQDAYIHLVRHLAFSEGGGRHEPFNVLFHALDRWLPPCANREAVIVAVVHPGVRLRQDCLAIVAGPRYFGDPRVTVVQVGERIINRADLDPLAEQRPRTGRMRKAWARLLVRLQDVQSQGPTMAARLALRRGGAVGFNGNGQFVRMSGLDALGGAEKRPWRSPSHEYDLSVHLLIRGHRTVYAHDTWGERAGPPTIGPLMLRQIRQARRNLGRARYLPALWRNPALNMRDTALAALILIRSWLGAIASFVYAMPVLALLATTALYPREAISAVPLVIWLSWGAIVFLGIIQFAVWGPLYALKVEPRSHPLQAAGWGAAYVGYLLLSCLATWLAIVSIGAGRRRRPYTRPGYTPHAQPTGSRGAEQGSAPATVERVRR